MNIYLHSIRLLILRQGCHGIKKDLCLRALDKIANTPQSFTLNISIFIPFIKAPTNFNSLLSPVHLLSNQNQAFDFQCIHLQ